MSSDLLPLPATDSRGRVVPPPSAWPAPWPKRLWAWATRGDGRYPLALFLLTRLAYMAFSFMSLQLIPTIYFHPEGRQRFLEPYPWLDGLCRWDCGWMVRIYEQGYSQLENAKVFPLMPLLGWALEKATGLHHLLGFLLIANLASLGAYIVVFKLFKELEGDDSARWALALFAAYPFAYYQAAAYPESLMTLSSALALMLAMKGRPFTAGLALGLGVMARHLTMFTGLGLFAAQVRQRGWHPRRLVFHPHFLGLAIPFLFVAAFFLYLGRATGDPLAALHSRTIGWNDWVWFGVRQTLLNVPYSERPEYFYYIVIALFPTAGAIALATRKRWAELAASGTVLMAIILSTGIAGLGRYSASVWPAFLPLGVWLSRRPALQVPVLLALALLQGLFFFLYVHQWRVL